MEGISKNGETGPQSPLWSRIKQTTEVLSLQPSWGRSDTFQGVQLTSWNSRATGLVSPAALFPSWNRVKKCHCYQVTRPAMFLGESCMSGPFTKPAIGTTLQRLPTAFKIHLAWLGLCPSWFYLLLYSAHQAPAILAVFLLLERPKLLPHLWDPESAIRSAQTVLLRVFTDQHLDIQGSAQISPVHQWIHLFKSHLPILFSS